jgi:glycosyltransferase involved in cell wall biosynthesis
VIKKIALVTSSHLSSNPRLVKEAKALLSHGYEIEIVCSQNLAFLAEFDKKIFKDLGQAKIHIVNCLKTSPSSIYLRFLSKIRLKINTILANFNVVIPRYRLLKFNRVMPEMRRILSSIQADLYIGHNLASLPVVAWAASFHNTKYAFDAEDFHRGEIKDLQEQLAIKDIEDRFFPDALYISTASPIITREHKKLYPNLNVFTINNVFPLENHDKIEADDRLIKIVWFSQTLGLNRGLNQLLDELHQLDPKNFEIHLRGYHTTDTRESILKSVNSKWQEKIHFYQQCDPEVLSQWLTNFDIGLALENKDTINRNICITNKIFQYLTAGLAILATETEGQTWLLNQIPAAGKIIDTKESSIVTILSEWKNDRELLALTKQAAINAARTKFNWDIEQIKLIEILEKFKNQCKSN